MASWDAAALSAVHESLSAAVPHDSPQVVLIAGGFDAATVATVEWLARRHGVELSCFAVSFLRFGSERLLTVRREFPPREANAPDPAAEVQQLLGEQVPSVGVATTTSAPPPGQLGARTPAGAAPAPAGVRRRQRCRWSSTSSRATCGSWSDAWSKNSALTCTESYVASWRSSRVTRIWSSVCELPSNT